LQPSWDSPFHGANPFTALVREGGSAAAERISVALAEEHRSGERDGEGRETARREPAINSIFDVCKLLKK
jgi:hypothetical protein